MRNHSTYTNIHTNFHNTILSKMKKILFALPVLTLAFLFTYCAKDPVSVESAPTTTVEDQSGASDRSPCTVNIAASGLVRVCGLATTGTPCQDCLLNASIGETGINFSYNVNSPNPVPFSITNLTPNVITVVVSTVSTNAVITIKPGGCKRFAEYECAIVTNAN